MKKKIAIIDTYYPAFLNAAGFNSEQMISYTQAKFDLMQLRFGTSDSYSSGLNGCGWDAEEIVPNSHTLQKAWCNENAVRVWKSFDQFPPSYISRIPLLSKAWECLPTLHRVLDKQLEKINPDVVYFQDLSFATNSFLKKAKSKGCLVVGQVASPLPPDERLKMYDLILSSLPNQIEYIRGIGVRSEFLPIGFDSRILESFNEDQERDIAVSFVGGISKHHPNTVPLLSAIAITHTDLHIYGYGAENLSGIKKLSDLHRGEKWGLQMYEVLRRSRITLNRHISVSENYANNMRLFEATGSGALLITDLKSNLHDYFDIGSEVLAYESFDEASDLVKWSNDHPEKASAIAKAGQNRTLSEHTYQHVAKKLDSILRLYI